MAVTDRRAGTHEFSRARASGGLVVLLSAAVSLLVPAGPPYPLGRALAPIDGSVLGRGVTSPRAMLRPAEPALHLVPQDRPRW